MKLTQNILKEQIKKAMKENAKKQDSEEKFNLSSEDVRKMIQEELENVLEARTFDPYRQSYMAPGEEEERMRRFDMMKNAQVSPEDKPPSPSMSGPEYYEISMIREIEKLSKDCDAGDLKACDKAIQLRRQAMNDGLQIRESKRKKNG